MTPTYALPAVQKRNLADQNTDHLDSDWFSQICHGLLPKDAGFCLHMTTGIDERSCYRYAAGERKPTGYLIYQLLRSERGHVWLKAIMDGSDVQWWRELEAARDLSSRYRIEIR